MIIKSDGYGGIQEINKVYMDDIELLCSGANAAGYLEANDRIVIESDTDLAWFLVSLSEKWYRDENCAVSFVELAEAELLKHYAPKA